MRRALLLASILIVAATSPAQIERVPKVLTGNCRTAHFNLRFRPNSRAGASVDRTAMLVEANVADICEKLAFDVGKARFVAYLFDDTAELAALTKVKGNAGFSAGHQTFVPTGNDQTLYHEMVHLIAFRLPKRGREPRNLFFAEGLANALLQFVHGVHVHAVAAVELRHELNGRKLPKLTEMTQTKDFYDWLRRHPNFNAYDVAASYIRFLIDTEGIEKVKRYYTGMPAQKAFGKSEAKLEVAWHRMLRAFKLRPSVVTLLGKRRGEKVAFDSMQLAADKRLPPELLGDPADWRPLAASAAAMKKSGTWQAVGETLQGRSKTNDWSALPLDHASVGDGALRVKVEVPQGTVGVKLQFGDACQALFTNAGLFLWSGGVKHINREERLSSGEFDLLIDRRGKRIRFYVDGKMVLGGDLTDTVAPPALGVAGGRAVFREIRFRKF